MTTSGIKYITSPEFQQDVARQIMRWDKEWVRYFHMHDRFYFYNMNSNNYALSVRKEDIAKMTKEEIFSTLLMGGQEDSALGIWVPGQALVDKTIVELGCGPGLLGKLVSRVSKRYIGIDYSKYALYLAKLVSPENCDYYCLDEINKLKTLEGKADLCVGRHFFIHQKIDNAAWILAMFKDMLKPGGLVSADFYSGRKLATTDKTYPAKKPLDPVNPSSMFFYSIEEIMELTDRVGLNFISIDEIEYPPRKIVIFGKSV